MTTLPKKVAQLTHAFEAWIVGSAADPANLTPRDYDLIIPYHRWNEAAMMIPEDAQRNTFGGYKFQDGDISVDVWPGDMWWILERPMCQYVYHPLSGTRWQKDIAAKDINAALEIIEKHELENASVKSTRTRIRKANQLKKFDIVKLVGRSDMIVVGEVLGKYDGSISISKMSGTATVMQSHPYPGCWAVQLLDSKSVVPISEILYDVEKAYRNGSAIHDKEWTI